MAAAASFAFLGWSMQGRIADSGSVANEQNWGFLVLYRPMPKVLMAASPKAFRFGKIDSWNPWKSFAYGHLQKKISI